MIQSHRKTFGEPYTCDDAGHQKWYEPCDLWYERCLWWYERFQDSDNKCDFISALSGLSAGGCAWISPADNARFQAVVAKNVSVEMPFMIAIEVIPKRVGCVGA